MRRLTRLLWPCLVLVAASLATAGDPTPSFADFDRRAQAGERLNVVFFGASLTWSANATDQAFTSYRADIARMIEAKYPAAHFKFIDGAIGGTGSQLGVFRLQRDCLKRQPDLVFLDFSANDDIYSANPETLASYESLVRRIVTEGKCPVVIVIFPFKWNSTPGTANDMARRIAHLKLAEAYNVPVGDAILHIQNLVKQDATVADKIWEIDGVHPGDFGYEKFAEAAWQGFMTGIEKKMECKAPEKMLYPDTYMTWNRCRLSGSPKLPAGWKVGLVTRTGAWHDGMMCRWLDDEIIAVNRRAEKGTDGKSQQVPVTVDRLRFKVKASFALLYGTKTTKSPKYKVYVDGKGVQRENKEKQLVDWTFDASSAMFGGNVQIAEMLVTGLDATTEHLLEIEPLFEADKDQEFRLESLCVAGGDATVKPVE